MSQHKIQIAFGGLIDLLSEHLYGDREAAIREIIGTLRHDAEALGALVHQAPA